MATKENHRKFMLLAIEQMRLSVHEQRSDGKATPSVGAVLLTKDGKVEVACRGELRDGDHAEFTLLERKNRSERLDGATLYTTLEPCAPGARAHPKLGCAERIKLARIKEVWVGIEDPDPTVDTKGINYLKDNGIAVKIFDRDLQEIIVNENKIFIAQAKERAGAAREERPAKVSKFDTPSPTAKFADLSKLAMQKYISDAGIADTVDSETFKQRLIQQQLLKEQDGEYVPTGYGILLFAKEPRNFLPQSGLLATVHDENGDTETQDFSGPMVLIPSEIEPWLKVRLPNIINRTKMQRKERAESLLELLRESIVNALIHRNYEIEGAKCQLVFNSKSIKIKSPGAPISPITLEQLQAFNAPMLSRNPQLHYIFTRMGLSEERGLGMSTIRSVPESLELPLPQYSFENPYLVLQIFSKREGVIENLDQETLAALTAEEIEGWKYVTSKLSLTSTDYSEAFDFDNRKSQRQLTKFVDLGLLRRIGKGKATHYEVVVQ